MIKSFWTGVAIGVAFLAGVVFGAVACFFIILGG